MLELIALVWIHFVADFVLQTDKVAINKSKSNLTLLQHVIVYSIPFLWFGVTFAVVNCAAHFVTDWISSRTASYFYQKDQRHWFFVTIGFDQAVHLTTLIATYHYLVK